MRTPQPQPRPDRQPRAPGADRPASGGRGRRARPGPPGFTFEVQLVGGEEGRQLEQEQTEAIIEVLAWLAAHPPIATPTASTATNAGMDAGTRTGRSGSGDAPPSRPMAGRPDQPGRPHSPDDRTRRSRSYPAAVRVHAVGLVGVGQPLGEVARALNVHPAALRRWVWQAWRRWAAAVGLPERLILLSVLMKAKKDRRSGQNTGAGGLEIRNLADSTSGHLDLR